MCSGNENSLLDCPRVPSAGVGVSDCSHSEDAGVRCEGVYMHTYMQYVVRVPYNACIFYTCIENTLIYYVFRVTYYASVIVQS